MFGLTHFGTQKYIFIETYCQQVIVADGFERTFLAHISQKNLNLIILSLLQSRGIAVISI